MSNKVKRLQDDLIYVEKVGDQTEESMVDLLTRIQVIAAELRADGKPVLILSNATQEGKMDIRARQTAAKIGKELDYDKSATYGAAAFLKLTRELMIQATQLNNKVKNFKTRKEAEDWLLRS